MIALPLCSRCAILTSVDQGGTLAVNCRGMEGRYVSVFIPHRREFLTLCEVQVFALPSEEPESGKYPQIKDKNF